MIAVRESVMKDRMVINNAERLNVQNEDNWSKDWHGRTSDKFIFL